LKVAVLATSRIAIPAPKYGGVELMIENLTEGLVKAGVDVTLFATGDSKTSAKLRYIHEKAIWPSNDIAENYHVKWAVESIKKEGFDIVQANNISILPFSKYLDIPIVYTIQHLKDIRYKIYEANPQIHYVAVDISQKDENYFLANFQIIPYGISKDDYVLSKKENYLAFLGRFSQYKGTHIAIDIARKLNIKIKVAGTYCNDEEKEYFDKELKWRFRLPLVEYIGEIGKEEKKNFLSKAKALLMPISWEEPFGVVMIEAMFSGTPVIAFNLGSVPRIIKNGINGYIIEKDNVKKMLETISLIDKIDPVKCRNYTIENFSRELMLKKYLKLFNSILDK